MAVGQTEERGGAAFENVRVRALRFPRESIEGREDGDFTGEAAGLEPDLAAGKMLEKKRSVSARASARRLELVMKKAGRRRVWVR